MQVGILGPLTVEQDGVPVPVGGVRLRRLLTRLAVGGSRGVSVPELSAAVWPEESPSDAINALQSLVSRLRRALGESGAIRQLPGSYRLESVDLDFEQFVDLTQRGQRSLLEKNLAAAARILSEALALWRGEPATDAGDAEYRAVFAAKMDEVRLGAVSALCEANLLLDSASENISILEELVRAYPLREHLSSLLLRSLAAEGRGAEALLVYESIREVLAEELGSDPGEELQKVHLALLRGELKSRVASKAMPRTNLRTWLTSFVGRENEVSAVGNLVSESRLTTIIGPGGAGKTRLSANVAALKSAEFPDGVWFVELAPVNEGSNIAQAILGALGLREARLLEKPSERMSRDATQRLLDELQTATTLLVIDNCEHLIVDVAVMVDQLLAYCPGLHILCTSREPLGVMGESLSLIPPLPFPSPTQESLLGAVEEYPALALLIERAGAVNPDICVDETTLPGLAEIVRRLDGLPLAIELAAAKLRVLPVDELAARLGDRFRLLTGGNRTAMPRHQTLRAVVEWSWELLSPDERLLAERLAVFPAGATESRATLICAGDRLHRADIPDLLMSLVDKSLLQVSGDGGVRYRMLETIREYGVERLVERGEAEAARHSHAAHFLLLCRYLDPLLRGPDQLGALATLRAERDNIIGALRFSIDSGHLENAVEFAVNLSWYWTMTGNHTEAVTWTESVLAAVGADSEIPGVPYLRAIQAISVVTNDDYAGTDWSESQQRMTELSEILKTVDYPTNGALEVLRPTLALFGGNVTGAFRLTRAALESPDPWVRGAVRMIRTYFSENNGDMNAVRADSEAAFVDFSKTGDRWGLSSVLAIRARVRTMDSDLPGAIADFEQALTYVGELGSVDDDMMLHLHLADLHMRLGDWEAARARVESVRGGPRTQQSTSQRMLFADTAMATLLLNTGELEGASALAKEMREQALGYPLEHPMQGHQTAVVCAVAAYICLQMGDIPGAINDLETGYAIAVATEDLPILAAFGVSVAALAASLLRWEDAAKVLGATAKLRGADDATDLHIRALRAQLEEHAGDEWLEWYDAGLRLSQKDAVARVDPGLLSVNSGH